MGAYSLVAVVIDKDGDNDLIVASNGNNHVSLWRNDGRGNFEKTVIYGEADFVLSVTAVDFDRDGDLDVASASFFDGHINWYENVDGKGYEWRNHTIYVGVQGHYVSYADMDGDGDDDLIAVMHAENTVAVFLAQTECDLDETHVKKQECCHSGTEWNGTACEPCVYGTYGIGSGLEAKCIACPKDACVIAGENYIPATCSGIAGCADVKSSIVECSCEANTMKDPKTDACATCPEGQIRPDPHKKRGLDTLGNYTLWELQQGICFVKEKEDHTVLIAVVVVAAVLALVAVAFIWRRQIALAKADAMWTIHKKEIQYDDPVEVLGKGSFGEVVKGYYRGTAVAIKGALPTTQPGITGAELQDASREGSEEEHFDQNERSRLSRLGSKEGKRAHIGSAVDSGTVSFDGNGVPVKMSNSELRKSFIQEMRLLSKLRHPCITTVMGAVLGEKPLLVMELMQYGSLRELLSNQTFPLDPEQTLPLIRDIMQGMRFIHSAEPPILHGDLKSANVLVDGNFRAKIADFGLSAKRRAVGTPFYMAPELLCGAPISTQSDVYSFGVLLWELMTHKYPYEELDDMDYKIILNKVSEGNLRPNCSGLDQELVECMQDCWQQDPDKRPTLQDLELKLIPLCGQNLFSVMQERTIVSKKQSTLLQDVFPEHIARDLLAGKKVSPENHESVAIYFSDIVDFTTISSTLGAAEVSDLLDRLYTQFDALAGKHQVFKLETIGDSWVGATNLVNPQMDYAARIARFSIDAIRAAYNTPIHHQKPELGYVKIRVGFHCGPVVSSVVGTRNPRYCLFGDTMNTASRMETTSTELRIQCSEIAACLAKEQDENLKFCQRGEIKVKGKGTMKTFYLNTGMIANNEADDLARFDDSQQRKDSSAELSKSFKEASSDFRLPFKEKAPECPKQDHDVEMGPEQALDA